MTALTVTLLLLTLLTLASLVMAAAAFCRQAPKSGPPDSRGQIESLRSALDGLAAQLHSLQDQPAAQPQAPPAPRAGMNLAKRSQALRLHRHGSSAAQIASALEIPIQEVELLLKVQRIVLSNI